MHGSYENLEEQLDENEDILISALNFQKADRLHDAMKYLKKSHEKLVKLGQFMDSSTRPISPTIPTKGDKKRASANHIVYL